MAAKKEEVARVIDGDTFITSGRKKPIRLANVDAPEMGQRGGSAAKKYLEGLIGGKVVKVDTLARDPYGRAVAHVHVGDKSVNAAMRRRLG